MTNMPSTSLLCCTRSTLQVRRLVAAGSARVTGEEAAGPGRQTKVGRL